ncbi:MAG: alpha-amylase [Acidobacteria bacterium Pan2503]|uniref:Alpha-amylase n=1 Tax=Candidatus Acidiferrum panamense TaxID=2741543 RepID=A0A7V8SXK8_9BACT|nr:alpha-amylase [Candidatus Acidoferrum panamensis]
MATTPRYPSLFQINTRVWLQGLSREAGKRVTLAEISDETIDGWAAAGFDWIWLLSVWQTGAAGRRISRDNPQWRDEFKTVLPDLTEDDICGSGFAITAYTVSDALGGEKALARFREKLAKCGIKLMLDFVPNHTAPDHPWVKTHPEYYVEGSSTALAVAPQNYMPVETDRGAKILAYGRDPNFPGWPDTLQLNYANPELQIARIDELIAIAGKCDGVRCDMAMLLLPEIFQRTWGITPEPFWPQATVAVRAKYPAFTFMAEVYWDLEWTLQQQGFDYCYDKRLNDRLKAGAVRPIHDHLLAGLDYQDKLARFLENHDEPRAAAEFSWPQHAAAAVITFLSPGLRFFHQGQFEGAHIRVPVHLSRGPVAPTDPAIAAFYARLLQVMKQTDALRSGTWSQIDPQPAWPGNESASNFIAFAWAGELGRYLVVANYASSQGQCRLPLPFSDLSGKQLRLTDLMGTEIYDRAGSDLAENGLYIDHAPWHRNVFELRTL